MHVGILKKKIQSWLRPRNCYQKYDKRFLQSWLHQQNCYSNIKMRTKMAEQAAEKPRLYNLFLKIAELAAPTKLLYNMRVWHIISHFFGGIFKFLCFLF
jgi:hypothetical protein